MPRTRLPPPVSIASFTTVGLTQGTLVGASASVSMVRMNLALRRVGSGRREDSTSASAARARARYDSIIPARKGLLVPGRVAEALVGGRRRGGGLDRLEHQPAQHVHPDRLVGERDVGHPARHAGRVGHRVGDDRVQRFAQRPHVEAGDVEAVGELFGR